MSSLRAFVFNNSRNVSNLLCRAYSSQEVPKYETLAVSVPTKHVFHVELNRPQKLNTFTHTMWLELKECFSSLSSNPECRVVLLSGQGKHFTGGIDLHSFANKAAEGNEIEDVARKARFLYQMIKQYQDSITSLEKCVKPVLAVTHNACVGAGVNIITAADIRYCTEDAWFQVKEVDIGLAADVGVLQRLPKVIGNTSIAREICYTARKVQSKEALELGLVSKVLPDKDAAIKEALSVAETIASKSPVAVQTTKLSLVYSQSRPNDDGLKHLRLLNQTMLQSSDLLNSAMAQITKSDSPEFENY